MIHAIRPGPAEFARRLAAAAEKLGHTIVGDEVTAKLLGGPVEEGDPEVVVASGGDGTVLAAVQKALTLDVPVLAFNLGTIGFLADAEPEDLDRVLDALGEGRLLERRRMTIKAVLADGTEAIGINDVVVEKIESQRLVSLKVTIDGEEFLTYRADGLVTATSTGSTAYNFSAGGPLVDPLIEALMLTPVASHSLFSRTMVLPPTARIRIDVTADRPVRVSTDGAETGSLDEGGHVDINVGDKPARFLALDSPPFPTTVKHKFRLG
ncbi:MAG: NAD(+)/NADH kinase [Acidimicrobiia bacterium]